MRVPTRSSGSLSDTREWGGTLRVRNTEPPMTLSAPTTVLTAQHRGIGVESGAALHRGDGASCRG